MLGAFDSDKPIGNYLSYAPFSTRGPNSETGHACANYGAIDEFGHWTGRSVSLGSAWFYDNTGARAWVENTVRAALASVGQNS